MRKLCYAGAGLVVTLALLSILAAAIGGRTPEARAVDPLIYVDLQPEPGKALTNDIPADCSTWHELYPSYCVMRHQDGYEDGDGDNQISPCDHITLDGVRYHITWVGPTYFLDCPPGGGAYHSEDPTGGDPTCETWHEIYPEFCTPHHVDGWIDNGDGVVSECDIVIVDGIECHIVEIGLDIIIEPGPTAVEESSWGKVKSLFRNIF